MKFSIDKEHIINEFQSLAAVADKKQTLPILSNILIRCEEDKVKLAIESGFKHTDTWWLSLSTQQGKQEQGSLDGTTEVKQKQQYMGEFTRPDIAGRKFEPTFIFQK